jgi:IrrE N-terminal-like domain
MQEISAEARGIMAKWSQFAGVKSDADRLKLRLRKIGLSDPAITAAWPGWWSHDAEASTSARTELRFSLARKLGLDPSSLLDEGEPRFVWHDEARFKHLSGEGALEQAAITSFGRALGNFLINATPSHFPLGNTNALLLRKTLLAYQPYVALSDLLLFCWSIGIPVVHLRVFPWPQKRMAAMSVRVADRYAILLGKDSQYPAHIAFYLAHEIGHIVKGHLERERAIVDLDSDEMGQDPNDHEEVAADKFALELLTGMESPKILPSTQRYTARSLARAVIGASQELKIEPGTLALCFGYSTQDWRTSTAAMRYIYREPVTVWKQINALARTQLASAQLPDDSAEYVQAVLGEEQRK